MPIGSVAAGGLIHGTGFTHQGHQTLALTLDARGGRLMIEATSALLPGITSP